MQELFRTGMTFLIGVFGVAGLFVASTGQRGLPYWGGIAFFIFCVLLIFKQIVDSEKPAH